jgi:3-phosphoshikimate 1-carboxyvinyltransferase
MDLIVHNTSLLSGSATPPSSKSQNIRALFFALLAGGQSTLCNILNSDDMTDAVRVCKSLGAEIQEQGSELTLKSPGLPLPDTHQSIYSGNSGITTRFALPLLGYRANHHLPLIFDCGEQMRARPIQTLVEALNNLGMSIEYLEKSGSFPLKVQGRLQGGRTEIGGLSSQYLSALLIALPCAERDSEITVSNLHERPYVEMTLNWLNKQNIQYQHRQHGGQDVFTIHGRQHYRSFKKIIAGDFSSASYLIAAGALLGGTVELQGLDMQDPQGDKRLVEILQQMGAHVRIQSSGLVIEGGNRLRGITIDANDIPDLLPTLAVIGSQAEGKTAILNVAQARIKETDRIHSIAQGLTRMGAKVEELADGLIVYPSRLQGSQIKGYGDHRTVMAMALAGLLAEGVTTIDDAQSIDKTFPSFIKIMQNLGAKMELRSASR